MKNQTYLQELDRWLTEELVKLREAIAEDPLLLDATPVDVFRKAIKAKILESYRNGQRSRAHREPTEAPSEVSK